MSAYRSVPRFCLSLAAAATLAVGVAPAPAVAAKKSDFADRCEELRKPFSKIQNYRKNQALKGALIGGLAGLATGVAVNSGKNNKGSVLPYVIAGAAAGGVIGYVAAKAQQSRNREEVQRAIAADFSGEVGNYDPLADKIVDLGNCRREQIYTVQHDYETQAIDGKEARARLVKLESWVTKDDEAISGAAGVQTERVAYYVRAQRLAEGARPQDTEAQDANFSYYTDPALQPAIQVTTVDESGAVIGGDPVAAPAATLFVKNRNGVNLRDQPNTGGRKLAMLPYRASAEVKQSTTPGWYEVRWNGQSGFAASTFFDGTLPPVAAAPVAKPKKGVRKIAVRKPKADTSSPQGQAKSAVASRNAAYQTRMRSAAETSAQLSDLRSSLT